MILASGIKTLPSRVFAGCRRLRELVLPEGLESMEEGALAYCEQLTELTLPASVKHIGGGAFASTGLTALDLPAGLTALARLSSINDAPPRCVAVLRRTLAFKADSERRYDGDVVQEWKYDPRLLAPAGGGTVDPLSLFLSLRNETDPRVQSALGKCLETIRW